MNNIGETINKAIRIKGISQKELAEKLGVSPAGVTKWVSGKSMPAADKFIEIVKLLDLVEEFFPDYVKKSKVVEEVWTPENEKILHEMTGDKIKDIIAKAIEEQSEQMQDAIIKMMERKAQGYIKEHKDE